ncbi:MAG TPA: hypothetical protein VLL07_06185 [Pontiella sp.]|nr:hypothetical protein [Pontiella sp.]
MTEAASQLSSPGRNWMKTTVCAASVIFLTTGLLLFSACGLRPQVPDPVKVQEEIAESKRQELALISATIADPERANRMIRLLDERDKLIAQSTRTINAYRDQMSNLNADYHADRESFETLIANYNSQRAVAQEKFTALIAAMKMEASPEEWKIISKFQIERLQPQRLTYGQPATGG